MTKTVAKSKTAASRQPFDVRTAAQTTVQQAKRYRVVAFVILIAAMYGFLLYRTNSLSNAMPSQDAVTSQVKAAKLPYIDQATVNQLQSLQDNSVNVQSLFDQARNNPF